MGTDIRVYVEKLNNGRWEAFLKHAGWESGEGFDCFWCDRNYELFAILADVRNVDNFELIGLPRGLPEDVSEAVRELALFPENYCHSWFGLQELLNFDWDKVAGECTRYVSPEAAELYRKDGTKPLESALCADSPWTELTWEMTYRECSPSFVEALQWLSTLADPKELRIVFWFEV